MLNKGQMLCFDWSTPDTINSLILLVSIVTAIFLYKTFTEGRKQTSISLSLSQFNIYYQEMVDFIQEAKDMRFESELGDKTSPSIKDAFGEVDGIYYLPLFHFASGTHYKFQDSKEDSYISYMNDFRFNVLFPLERFYDRLYYFLTAIKSDSILKKEHRNILYGKAERDILPMYFRVCNYLAFDEKNKNYDLSIFDTEAYKSKAFYRINDFYIENALFQYKDLDFYKQAN